MRHDRDTTSTTSSVISASAIQEMLEEFQFKCHRNSTRSNYYSIWKHFNEFLVQLDQKPGTWEDRLLLFVGHLIQHKHKSNTIKSYILAIHAILREVGYHLKEDTALLGALTKATKLHFDRYRSYLPIRRSMLNMLLASVEKFLVTIHNLILLNFTEL